MTKGDEGYHRENVADRSGKTENPRANLTGGSGPSKKDYPENLSDREIGWAKQMSQ